MNRRIAVIASCLLTLVALVNPFTYSQTNTNSTPAYQVTELFTIGSEKEDDEANPYFFYSCHSLDCDNDGNIYALDWNGRHVKKFDSQGKYIRQFFQQGEGPGDVANPFAIAINRHSNHIVVLQSYGFYFKEFDLEGKYVKMYQLPQQFFGKFFFLDHDQFVYMNSVPHADKFFNFHIASLKEKKIVKEFAQVEMRHELNMMQYFSIMGGNILWTSRGNDMKLLAFDLKTGDKVQEIQIPGEYQENIVLEKGMANQMKMVYPIIYNMAQPFVIDEQLFVLVVVQEFEKKDGELDRFPVRWKRTIYQVNGTQFQELKTLTADESLYIGTVFKNRLFLNGDTPYSRIRVLEFKKPGI